MNKHNINIASPATGRQDDLPAIMPAPSSEQGPSLKDVWRSELQSARKQVRTTHPETQSLSGLNSEAPCSAFAAVSKQSDDGEKSDQEEDESPGDGTPCGEETSSTQALSATTSDAPSNLDANPIFTNILQTRVSDHPSQLADMHRDRELSCSNASVIRASSSVSSSRQQDIEELSEEENLASLSLSMTAKGDEKKSTTIDSFILDGPLSSPDAFPPFPFQSITNDVSEKSDAVLDQENSVAPADSVMPDILTVESNFDEVNINAECKILTDKLGNVAGKDGMFELLMPNGKTVGVFVEMTDTEARFVLTPQEADLGKRIKEQQANMERNLKERLRRKTKISVLF